ncbi:cAMP-dependent protein kinase catalytic subunit alpha-like [Tropilaelaps mercedesae]|uniref:cAMP-dependent protein kinase catalytic subunit alpha-like n=1 Tax=Tropilaelaps mercedesae TaxID=418985 RepID=A0A1V9XY87_9ACAR|nr:cAMP-dependent protein kinase catalytic subunit alpha-like [Tropilaelaps mercedesae]
MQRSCRQKSTSKNGDQGVQKSASINTGGSYGAFLSGKTYELKSNLDRASCTIRENDNAFAIVTSEFNIIREQHVDLHSMVVELQHKTKNTSYALKVRLRTSDTELEQRINNEVYFNGAVNFEFIVSLFLSAKDNFCAYLVSELATCGTLLELVDKYPRLQEDHVRFLLAQVVLALEYLSSADIAFRSVQAKNLLVFSDGYLKLTDFRLAKRIVPGEKTYTICGEYSYRAPEMYSPAGYMNTIDWWSLGVLAHFVFFGRIPEALAYVNDGPPKFAGNICIPATSCSDAAKLFLLSLLTIEPFQRLGVTGFGPDQLRNHKFFASIDWLCLYEKRQPSPISIPEANQGREFTKIWFRGSPPTFQMQKT